MRAMELPQILFLLILAGALYLFVSERLRVDVTAMLTLLALVLTGVLDSKQALSGFASEPAIIIAAVFVISGGLAATGITERIGQWIGQVGGRSETRAIAVVMPVVAALSSFTHHVMVTAMMLPILTRFAKLRGLSASRWCWSGWSTCCSHGGYCPSAAAMPATTSTCGWTVTAPNC